MKKIFVFISIYFLAASLVFSQNAESPVPQMDESVRTLARGIHAKLVEKRAEKFIVGQFVLQGGSSTFTSYWVNQLILEISTIQGRNYTVLSPGSSDADWTITGEILVVADIVRVYSRLVRTSDRSIETSFFSDFQRNEHINLIIASGGGGQGGGSGSGSDPYEPDSWESPVTYTIGTSQQNAVAMNRAITEGDEDFFLLVPDRDGRLTVETTGSIDTYMYLYELESGDALGENDDGGQGTNARINHSVTAGTQYLAVVRGYSNSTSGPYAFRAYIVVREGASSWANPISYEIGSGDSITTVNRRIDAGDEDYFLLVPDRDGRITIETTGRIDTYMELYNANDRDDLLDEDDDSGQSNNALIRYTVRAGNRYIVVVRGYSERVSGSFGFKASYSSAGSLSGDEFEPNDEPSNAGAIEIGTTYQLTFHSGDDVDWFVFNVTRAGRYIINARGANSNRLDTYIELYDSNLNLIAEDDDGGDSLSSRLSQNLTAGRYYIKVWCLDEEPSQGYTLSVTQ
ncbi:MAG: PPC domain-containing protein [Treponema sp.]|jgi:hypothetical protein|nr:PPC domain-containing protein [Treponema sp.]